MNGFCVCSPEFTFVQAAAICELPKFIEIGYELCGTYDLSGGGYRECAPLTTVERLTAFAGAADGVHGVRKARRALRYVAERSASPRETVLTMLLCLPYGLGGYGIEMPLLNHRVDVVGDALKMTSKKYCVCDLFWPKANLVIEYGGGGVAHRDRARIERFDAPRRVGGDGVHGDNCNEMADQQWKRHQRDSACGGRALRQAIAL